jgi:hypothetical protein
MRNETAAALTLTQGSGANVVIAAGQTKIVSTDGGGVGAIVYEMDNLELAGNLIASAATLSTLAVTGALTVDTNTLVVDATNNRVGIGTSTPDTTLHLQTPSGTKSEINFAQTAVTNYRIGVPASTDALVFTYGASTERLRIDSTGNVGIGCSPSYPLEVAGAAGDSLTITARSGDATAANNAGGGFRNIGSATATSRSAQMWLDADGANLGGGDYFYIEKKGNSGDLILSQYSNADMIFQVYGGNERMRITSDGKLVVNGTVAGFSGTDITVGSPSQASSGLSILTSTAGTGYVLFGDVTGNASGGYSGQINYNNGTNRMGFNTNNVERLAIDGSGNAMVGTTTQYFARFSVQGETFQNAVTVRVGTNGYPAINFQNTAGAQQGYIVTNASSVQYVSISDQRAKENIADADDAGSKIDSIQVRKFDWIADGSHQDYGMIAQELQAVAPEAVSGDADSENMMGVDYSKLVPMLVKEIQSLRTRVQELENN